jgi:hypothetical protein
MTDVCFWKALLKPKYTEGEKVSVLGEAQGASHGSFNST